MSTLATTNLKNPSSGSDNIVLGTDGSSTLSTAKLTTLADSAGANTSTPAEIASGRAKAWVNFDGTGTVAIRASFNVSSITDNGTGSYTVNFATALVDANYVCNVSASNATDAGNLNPPAGVDRAASSVRIDVESSTPTQFDAELIDVAIFR
jgi:hypothetical protein